LTSKLGARLRALRQAKGYTVSQTASLAGLSRSFVSMLENGKTSISAERLERLAAVFGLRASDVLPDTSSTSLIQVVRAGTGPRVPNAGPGVEITLLSNDLHRLLQPVIMRLAPGASYVNEVGHAGEELVYVLSGALELRVDTVAVELREGDTAHYPSALRHGYANLGDGEAVLMTISTPPKLI